MPGIDGFETYRRLRAMQGQEGLPVIFVTAEGDTEMVAQGSSVGGIDYVTKPHPARAAAGPRAQPLAALAVYHLSRWPWAIWRISRPQYPRFVYLAW